MRTGHLTLVLCGLLAAGLQPAAAEPGRQQGVLYSKAGFAGGSVAGAQPCVGSCVGFEVRPGERYLHLLSETVFPNSSDPREPLQVAMDVKTAAGYVRVCSTTGEPLSVDGLSYVIVSVVLDDPTCQPSGLTGTLVAYFAERSLSLDEAIRRAEPDPGRQVTGGI